MAITEMSKLRLIGLTAERNAVLNALAESGLAEIKECAAPENTAYHGEENALSVLTEKEEKVNNAIARLSRAVEGYLRDHKVKCDYLRENYEVGFTDFISAEGTEEKVFSVCEEVERLASRGADASAGITRMNARLKALAPYAGVEERFSQFSDTKTSAVYFGSIPTDKLADFKAYAENADLVDFEEWEPAGDQTAVLIVAHRSVSDAALSEINALGFQRCPFAGDFTARALTDECNGEIRAFTKQKEECEESLFALGENLRGMKILADYYAFGKEKLAAAEKFPSTATAFMLEAYVPKEAENKVSSAINGVSENIYYEYAEISDDEMPPTLMKNNKIVKNFEFVTNMYTPPNYREFDPNAVMSVFFSIFMGFIMADIGYGILMCLGGFLLASRQKRDTGMRRLEMVIGVGGIFTIIFGFLFGSFFGFSSVPTSTNTFTVPFLPKPILPDAQESMVSLAGINIPAILLLALAMGIVQLMASNACKAYGEFRKGNVAEGIFFGIVWVVFLGGALLLVLGLTEELGMGYLVLPGGIIAVAALVIGAATAGIRERGFGKITKGFGAVYGIINYLSDILSYARLYGLMLSGAIIAQIASGQGMLLVVSGNIGFAVLGVVVMIIGHAFNLAMGLLGAYIHDARLQYIEFFSRFYGGEGELFSPFGSKRKYITFVN
ncbi:MAG: hypothetical protein IJR61_01275 [Clostridia bacterium]|nr:hypothetical protein [Clostridia bacterium]